MYVDAAKGLAERVLEERPEASLEQQLEYAFRIAVARPPSQRERDTLQRLYESELAAFPNAVFPDKSAAWFAVASTLLNLDETITKE